MEINHKLLHKPLVVCLLAMLCCALWGSAFPFIKIGYELLDIQSDDWAGQILFAGIRFFIAGILVIVFGSLLSKKFLYPKVSSIGKVCVLSLFQTILQYIFFYIGLAHTTGTKGSIINGAGAFFAVLVSALIFHLEKLNTKNIIGCLIGFAGVVIINLNGEKLEASFTFTGEGFIVICALAYAFSSALIKKYSRSENPVTLSGYQFILGGLVMIAAGMISGARINGFGIRSVLLVIYLAFLSAAAYTLWGILLKYNNVSSVAVYGFMTQIFGCLLSALFLNENMEQSGVITLISLILVSLGIIIVNVNIKFPIKEDKISK